MNRLTYYEAGYARYDFNGCQYQNEIASRLAAYEDTGLTPEEIVEKLEVKRGRWVHLGGDEWVCSKCGFVISTEGSWEHPVEDRQKFFCESCGADMREDAGE